MTPDERAERERRELIYRRHAEMQVIQLAIKDHTGCAPEWCGGSNLDPCSLFNAIEKLHDYYQRTGASLAEAFEREAEALVRQLDAPQVPAEPQHDPLSGDLIPAGQDAELERMGHDMAAPGSAFAELVRPEIEAMGNPVRDLAIQQGILPADQELSEYRPAPEPLIYAHDPHCNAQHEAGPQACPPPEPEIHTASTVATAELSAALERQRDELIWHPRTMKDARKSDQIRPAGSDMPNGTAVTDRYVPAAPGYSDRGTWHVVSGGAKYWDDHVVQPGEVWLRLDGGAPRNVDPDFPIEILLTRAEIAAIELLGWDNRKETRS